MQPVSDADRAKLRDELHRLAVARAVLVLPPNARVVSVSPAAWGHTASDFVAHADSLSPQRPSREGGT